MIEYVAKRPPSEFHVEVRRTTHHLRTPQEDPVVGNWESFFVTESRALALSYADRNDDVLLVRIREVLL